MECRRRLRRSRVMQKDASATVEAQDYEQNPRPRVVSGGVRSEASADDNLSGEESATTESARPLVAEVDHFRPLRAR